MAELIMKETTSFRAPEVRQEKLEAVHGEVAGAFDSVKSVGGARRRHGRDPRSRVGTGIPGLGGHR